MIETFFRRRIFAEIETSQKHHSTATNPQKQCSRKRCRSVAHTTGQWSATRVDLHVDSRTFSVGQSKPFYAYAWYSFVLEFRREQDKNVHQSCLGALIFYTKLYRKLAVSQTMLFVLFKNWSQEQIAGKRPNLAQFGSSIPCFQNLIWFDLICLTRIVQ